MKNLLKSQRGMSMINVMIAGALVAGMALTVSKMGKSTRQLTKSSETTTDLLQVQNRIERTLLDDRGCMNNLYDITLSDPVSSGQSTSTTIDKLVDASNRTIIKRNEPVEGSKNISIKNIELLRHYKADIVNSTASTKRSELELVVTFFKGNIEDAIVLDEDGNETVGKKNSKGKDVIGGGSIKKRFYLSALFDQAGKVDKCYSQLDAAVSTARRQTCNDVGGIFITKDTEDKFYYAGRNSLFRRLITGKYCRDFSGCPSAYPDTLVQPSRTTGCFAKCSKPLSPAVEKCELLPGTKKNIVLEPFKTAPEEIGVALYVTKNGSIVSEVNKNTTDKQTIDSGNKKNYYCNCYHPSEAERDAACKSKIGSEWSYNSSLGSYSKCDKGSRKSRCTRAKTRNSKTICVREPTMLGYLVKPNITEEAEVEQCQDTIWTPSAEGTCSTDDIEQTSNCGTVRVVAGEIIEDWIHTNDSTEVETSITEVCKSEERTFVNTCSGESKTALGEKTCLSDLQGSN